MKKIKYLGMVVEGFSGNEWLAIGPIKSWEWGNTGDHIEVKGDFMMMTIKDEVWTKDGREQLYVDHDDAFETLQKAQQNIFKKLFM